MQLADAEKLALELMAEFRLIKPKDSLSLYPNGNGAYWFAGPKHDVLVGSPWHFAFDDAKRRFGCCFHDSKTITLSRELTLRNDREQVEDTIRHEIAHALCTPKPRKRGVKNASHGEEWKRMCAFTGAKPKACIRADEIERVEGNWIATCNGCGRVHYKFRRPKRELYCAHKECRAKNPPEYGQGKFHPICKLVWRHKNALPEPKPCRAAIDAMKAILRAQESK